MERITKLITGQVIIDKTPGEYSFEPKKKTLILKNLTSDEVEVVSLPLGKDSISFIKDTELNGGAFVKFAEDDVYNEVYVLDETELNIVLGKLKRDATELSL